MNHDSFRDSLEGAREPSLVRQMSFASEHALDVPDNTAYLARAADVVKKIDRVHHTLITLHEFQSSAVFRPIFFLVDSGRKLVGIPSLLTTTHELFQESLGHMESLCALSEDIFRGAEREYFRLEELVDRSINEREQNLQRRTELEERIPAIIEEYRAVSEAFEGMKPGEVRDGRCYFDLLRQKVRMERRLDIEGRSAYALALDRELGTDQISAFYEGMERLFRCAYITTRRVREGASTIFVALRDTYHTYRQFDSLYQAALACNRGLASLSSFHSQLNTNFSRDMREMSTLLHDNPHLEMFSQTNPGLSRLISDIQDAEARHTYRAEQRVKER